MSRRANPLPPDERRAQILRVTEPLLLEHGSRVTTRQIAEAAGVAEGTLFRLYPTKHDLLHAVVLDALDPTDTCDALAAIDLELPLAERLREAVVAMQSQVIRIGSLMTAMQDLSHERNDPAQRKHTMEAFERQSHAVLSALEAVIAPDADVLGLSPPQTAAYLRAMVFVIRHPMMEITDLTDPSDLVGVLLHGIHTSTSTIRPEREDS